MRYLARMGLSLCMLGLFMSPALADAPISASVVKVEVLKRSLNLSSPWRKSTPSQSHGTGVFIDKRRLVTNAHVVAVASEITISLGGSSEKHDCRLLAIAPEIDLALLEVDSSPAIDAIEPVAICSKLPAIRSTLQVYGYPVGGDTLSVTEGIISRIEYASDMLRNYVLRIQVDAALNPGNSGGPAIIDNELVGLSRSKLGGTDNIGYLVSAEEISWFLEDAKDGTYDGKPMVFDESQALENESLRRKLGVPDEVTGLLLQRIISDDPKYPLHANDILVSIGNYKVSNRGQVRSEGLDLACQYAIMKECVDQKIPVSVLRDGQSISFEVPAVYSRDLVIDKLGNHSPSYFVFGSLVFVPATSEFMQALDQMLISSNNSARQAAAVSLLGLQQRKSPLLMRRFDPKQFVDEELVMVATPLLPHRISRGYGSPAMHVLDSVNGTKIRNMRHLVEFIRDSKEDFLEFMFLDIGSDRIVFDRKKALDAMKDIMEENGIVTECSSDLMPVWQAK